ncbi:porin family protein [Olleya aquimaris]|uniref:Outer membrane beta-barrel protein n=1 Tax=Olleya sediminilitoris TaxID=2795739 RepID=A0ABS1WI16_9FLAO|nr:MULTISPECIES: outer membrane beta-barrel protein [Olleya]AXO79461.1 porin family protein [Olleya aquimaris]MBL7558774.1 outer membrane beta-barrel protein [Olleya sediminilitoris]
MKKLLFTAAIAVLGFTSVNAQDEMTTVGGFEEGDVFISGSVGFGNESFGDESTNVFSIAPKAGYFLSDNIAAGLKLGYTSFSGDNDGVDFVDASELAIGVFGRYYFTADDQFSLFTELGVDYISNDDKLADAKSDGFDIAFAPGISYFVSDNFAIEATVGVLGYSTEKADFDGAESRNNFDFGVNFADINFGVVYKFN